MPSPRLETERLILRAPRASDVGAWMTFMISARARFIGGGEDCERGRAWRAFAALTGHWPLMGCGPFVMETRDGGRPVGSAGPWIPGDWPEPELSWSVWDPAFEGRGLAAEAVTAVREHVFKDLGWSTAVSYVDPANTRSCRLAERLGCILDTQAAVPGAIDGVLAYRHPRPD